MLSLARLRPNFNRVTQNVWVGGINHPSFIVDKGFGAVVDLRMIDEDKYNLYLEKSEIECLKRPMTDGYGVSPEVLLDIVKWIVARVKTGTKVLIHCNLGRGRGALVVSSYLVYSGLDPKTAFMFVKKRRRVTYLNSHQKNALRFFARKITDILNTTESKET